MTSNTKNDVFGSFNIVTKCKDTNGRVSNFQLSNKLNLPIFMPVATYGAMRAVPMSEISEEIILSNTYHCRDFRLSVKEFSNLKSTSLLTDSGGFQIQSLPCKIIDEGVQFTLLTDTPVFKPEDSIRTQITLGADIIMQLDDVVNPKEEYDRHSEAVDRSIRWLDRCRNTLFEESEDDVDVTVKRVKCCIKDSGCIKNNQILFPIIQGGLNKDLRDISIKEILKRSPTGLAIGGLCGGETKEDFIEIIYYTVNKLRASGYNGPIYTMGVGYIDDIIIIAALGSDMSDCVFPTRTARFGNILRLHQHPITIKTKSAFEHKFTNEEITGKLSNLTKCNCSTCTSYSLIFLFNLKKTSDTSNFCSLLTKHNMQVMRDLTKEIRAAISEERFVEYIKSHFDSKFKNEMPKWVNYFYKLFNIK